MHFAHQVAVTTQTVFVRHASIHFGNPNWLGERVERKPHTVVHAIDRLDRILRDEIVVRGMAVIACSHRLVAGVIPGIELIAHHVAIHARLRII